MLVSHWSTEVWKPTPTTEILVSYWSTEVWKLTPTTEILASHWPVEVLNLTPTRDFLLSHWSAVVWKLTPTTEMLPSHWSAEVWKVTPAPLILIGQYPNGKLQYSRERKQHGEKSFYIIQGVIVNRYPYKKDNQWFGINCTKLIRNT